MNNLTRDRIKGLLYRFFESKAYPLTVCALAFLSSVFAIEIFVLPLVAVMFFLASAVCDSAKVLIITFITFCLYISNTHSPSHTVSGIYGDGNTAYYFSEWRLPLFLLAVSLIVGGSLLFFFKNKCYKRISVKHDLLFWGVVAFSVALLLGGAFSKWYFDGFLISLDQICVYAVFYFLFAYGFKQDESRDSLMQYFSYISAITSGVVMLQLTHLYITSDIIFIDGGINKEGVILGWGIWTLVGIFLAMLIPAIFYNALSGGWRGFVYFTVATLTLAFAILSMSRGAQLISVAVYGICVIVAAFKSKNRLFYRIILVAIAVLSVAAAIIVFDKISSAFLGFFDDNGRVEHAQIAITNFLNYPIFGVGFAAFEEIASLPEYLSPMGPLPSMAHCTPLQLLSATGIFGLLAYAFYRVASILPVLKKRTVSGVFAFMGASVVLIGGLIDNFPFDIYPMFYSLIALAISHRTVDGAVS